MLKSVCRTHSRVLCIVAVPTLKVDFTWFIKDQILAGYENCLEQGYPIKVIEMAKYENTMYSIVLKMKTQNMADKFFSAFNGRYFRDDNIDLGSGASETGHDGMVYQNEIMYTL